MTVEVALVISLVSCAVSVFSVLKNTKHTDIKDVEARVADATRLEVKIDNILSAIDDIKSEVKGQRETINAITTRLVEVEASAKQAHKRIDGIETRI